MARLDRLSAAKEVAQRAAVLGREFGYPLLAAMVGMDEAALRQGLGRLVDAEILFARGEPPTATYAFKHALIQETAYQSLLKRTRSRHSHARVVRALVAEFPERAEAEPEVVARHAEAAQLRDEAVAYYGANGGARHSSARRTRRRYSTCERQSPISGRCVSARSATRVSGGCRWSLPARSWRFVATPMARPRQRTSARGRCARTAATPPSSSGCSAGSRPSTSRVASWIGPSRWRSACSRSGKIRATMPW